MIKNEVIAFNRKYEKIEPLRFSSSIIDLTTLEDRVFWSIVFFIVFFSDHSILSLFTKIFIVCCIWLIILILEERRLLSRDGSKISSSKAVTTITTDTTATIENNRYASNLNRSRVNSSQNEISSSISIVQCDFYIPTVKILDHSSGGSTSSSGNSNNRNSMMNKSDYLWNMIQNSSSTTIPTTSTTTTTSTSTVPSSSGSSNQSNYTATTAILSDSSTPGVSDVEHDEDEVREKQRALLQSTRLQFKITIICNNDKKWDVWRTYDECIQAYNQLVRKYPTQYVPKLASFRRIKRNYERDLIQHNYMSSKTIPSSTAFNALQQLRSTMEEDDKQLLGQHRFLSYLQIELLHWLNLLRSSFEMGDDECIISLLNIPQSSKPIIGFGGEKHACVVPLILEPRDQTNFPDIIPENDDDDNNETTTNWQVLEEEEMKNKDALMNDPDMNKIYETDYGIKYKGVTIDTFEFLDLSEDLKNMVSDARYSHGFKVRGLHYIDDKKKVEAGPAIGKLILMDIFQVDINQYGDRHDHICAYGKAKKRIEIMRKVIKDLYQIFVYNLQIPGDPPYSMVFYFAISKDFHKRNPSLLKAKKMLDRFIDIPFSEVEEHQDEVVEEVVVKQLAGSEEVKREEGQQGENPANSVESVPSNEMLSTSQQVGQGVGGRLEQQQQQQQATPMNGSTSNNNVVPFDYEVIGEAKIISTKLPVSSTITSSVKTTTDGSEMRNDSNNSNKEISSSSSSSAPEDASVVLPSVSSSVMTSMKVEDSNVPSIEPSGDSSIRLPPTTAPGESVVNKPVGSSEAESSSTPATVATATTTPPVTKPAAPSASRKNVTQKSWTSDIVWPEVGEPGVYDRKSFQNLRFKLVPKLLEAPWVLQMAVRSQPVIVGQKVVQRYFRGPSYIEVDLHVGSSTIANNVVSLCRTYSKAFVCNIGVVLQGENEDELPEEVLAVACINRVDLDKGEKLD